MTPQTVNRTTVPESGSLDKTTHGPVPGPRSDGTESVSISPDHLTEQARRLSEATQAAIDIAAGR